LYIFKPLKREEELDEKRREIQDELSRYIQKTSSVKLKLESYDKVNIQIERAIAAIKKEIESR
jgi:hypothetical protein